MKYWLLLCCGLSATAGECLIGLVNTNTNPASYRYTPLVRVGTNEWMLAPATRSVDTFSVSLPGTNRWLLQTAVIESNDALLSWSTYRRPLQAPLTNELFTCGFPNRGSKPILVRVVPQP